MTNPIVYDWSGDMEPFIVSDSWDPKNPLAIAPEGMLEDVVESYRFSCPEEMEMLTFRETGENIQRCRACGDRFHADYLSDFTVSSFLSSHKTCLRHNQDKYGNYFCPDCLVNQHPTIQNQDTGEIMKAQVCDRCRKVWEKWGGYAYRVRWIRRSLPKWVVSQYGGG